MVLSILKTLLASGSPPNFGVRASESGEAVADVRIEVTFAYPLTPEGQRPASIELTGRTDRDGWWTGELPPLGEGDYLFIKLGHPDFVSVTHYESLRASDGTPGQLVDLTSSGERLRLHVEMERGRAIAGRLVTDDEVPIAGWPIAVQGEDPPGWSPTVRAESGGREVTIAEPTHEPKRKALSMVSRQCVSAGDGSFTLHLPDGFATEILCVGDVRPETSERLAIVPIQEGFRVVAIESVDHLASLAERIVIEGTASLSLQTEMVDDAPIDVEYKARVARTDATFTVKAKPGQPATLTFPAVSDWPPLGLSIRAVAVGQPLASPVRSVRLASGEQEETFAVRETTAMRVRAVEPDGTPIPRLVFFDAGMFGYQGDDYRPYPPPLHAKSPQQATDEDGLWIWPDAAPGEWLFHVWDGDRHRHWVRAVTTPEEQILELEPGEGYSPPT